MTGMASDQILRQLTRKLLPWFHENQRDLPWRKDCEPYHVWLSEIMLQQTRVEAVKPYYARFLDAIPDIKALSECEHDTLMKLWEGLGYYSRARNLQKAAQQIMADFGGVNLTRDFIPVLDLDGVPCMYDQVTKQMFYNSGTGNFLYGEL